MKTAFRRIVLGLVVAGAVIAAVSVAPAAFGCHSSNGCDVCDTPAYQVAEQTCILRTYVCNDGSWTEEYCWG